MTTTFIAPDIMCDGCAGSIKTALAGQEGIRRVSVSVPDKTVNVDFDENATSRDQLAVLLDEIGFPPKLNEA